MNKLILAVLIAAFLLIMPAQATIYVGGDDGVTSISEAIEKAKENETIIVSEGIYSENVVIDKPLVLKASGNVTIEARNDSATVVWIKAHNVVFSSFNVKEGYIGIRLNNVQNCKIENNSVFENDYGIALLSSSGNTIANNTAFNNKVNGILLRDSSDTNEITNNTVCENSDVGLQIQDSTENLVTHNSLFMNLYGIGLIRANKNELWNNNVVDSKNYQARVQDSYLNTFNYNYWSDYEAQYPNAQEKSNTGIGDIPYEIDAANKDDYPYLDYSGWLNVVITPEYWEFYTKKGDIQYFYKNFRIQNRLNSPTEVEILLDQNLEAVTDSEITSTKTFRIAPKSTENITLRLNVTNLEGYILRTITFKTEDYTKTTLVHGLVQSKINEVKIEGVDYHRNVVKGQINPFNVMLRNHGDHDDFDITLTMGSKEKSKQVFLSDNKSVTKTVPFEIDTSDMPLGITRGQVVVLKSNHLSDPPLDYLNLTMYVASELEASTLIVTNLSRFNESEDLRHELVSLTHHPAVNGILLDVSCDYTEFDSNYKANELCDAIKNQIETVITEYPNIKYLILVGDDRVIPFYRVWDGTSEVFTRETGLPDESEYYYSDHYPNPVSETIDEALSSNQFLTDDFYSTLEGDRVLAVGRLVEKPDEVIRAIDMFFNYYQLTPTDVFVTSCETAGYEFMYDGSEECYQEWSKRINTTFKYLYRKGSNYGQPHEIIDGICNSSVSAIFLHANYDQFEVPPGKGGGENGYLEAEELKMLNGSLIYSIGCHAGLTIPNVTDLPQSFLSNGTIAYIAPTGYGLGGVITVAGHERLLGYLTKRIARGEDVGFALLNAKNDYYLDNFHMDTVDDKVLRSLTLYGFPMYTVKLDSQPSAKSESACATSLLGHTARKLSTAALGGDTFELHAKEDIAYTASNITLEKVTIILEPTCNVVKTENGTYYTYEGYTTEAGMPILPKATLYFIRGEKEIRGLVLRSAKFDVKDTTLVVETFAVSDGIGRSYNFTGWYPTIPFTLNSIEDRQSIVTASAQYKLIRRVSINAWQGTIRLFNETVLELFRVPESADREKPVVDVAIDTGTVTVKAEDNAGIYDVFITYLGPGNRTWASKTIDKQDRGKLSVEYSIQLNNTAFFVQVVDVDGNVKIDDNNGDYYVC
jgi:parallel beta-helix repeat protein